jgi:hypothetical protein
MGTVCGQSNIATAVGSLLATFARKHIEMKVVWTIEVILDDRLSDQWRWLVEDLTVVELGAIDRITIEALFLFLAREGRQLLFYERLLGADHFLLGLSLLLVTPVIDEGRDTLSRVCWPAARAMVHAKTGATGAGELVNLLVGANVVAVAVILISVHTC